MAILIKAANHPCWCAGEFFWERQGMEEEIQITDAEYEATRMFLSSGISAELKVTFAVAVSRRTGFNPIFLAHES